MLWWAPVACSAPESEGLRGNGTVYFPRDASDTSAAAAEPTPEPTVEAVPTAGIPALPTPQPDPIVAPDALPTAPVGSTYQEMHVVPVVTGKPPVAAALPARRVNMVLSGHISSPNEGAVFHNLPELKVGQGVIIATDERQYLYRVTDVKTVTPDAVSVLDQTPDPTATLITCVPDGIYSHRLVVNRPPRLRGGRGDVAPSGYPWRR